MGVKGVLKPRIKNDLFRIITSKGLTQREYADLVDIKREYINRLGHGHICPTVRTAIKIARALDTTVETIWG